MAAQIPKLMDQFEKDQLAEYTPCNFSDRNEIVKALAEVHTELVLIHPFREGNGRCSRILATIMALQAGLPILDFSIISGPKKKDYFTAVQIAMGRDWRSYLRKLSRFRFRRCRRSRSARHFRKLLPY